MKRLIAALISMWMVNTAVAQMALESCEEIPALAADVMTSRQVSYDIMLMINRFTDVYADRTELMSWAQPMIDLAYSTPIAADRTQQVQDFQAYWLDRCQSTIR